MFNGKKCYVSSIFFTCTLTDFTTLFKYVYVYEIYEILHLVIVKYEMGLFSTSKRKL